MIIRLAWSTIKQGVVGFWRNKNTTVSSVISNACVFLILGIVIVLILSANNVTRELQASVNQMHVFIHKGLTDDQIGQLEARMKARPEVLAVTFISKEQAWEEFKENVDQDSHFMDALTKNPLQHSYIVRLKDISMAPSLTEALNRMPEVEQVNAHQDMMENLMKIAKYIKFGGVLLLLVLMAIAVLIISNTTKIAIASRRKEINIMKYVGASNGYIKGPFVVEAMIIGFLSAFLAVLVVRFAYAYFYENAGRDLYRILTFHLVSPKLLVEDVSVIFAAMGLGIGAIGSILSLRKYVRV